MKKPLLWIGAIAMAHLVNAQNLVPNFSFETYTTCPTTTVAPITPLTVNDWFLPGRGTSDYFNVCNNSINGTVGVPNNIFGYQAAIAGDGYTGMFVYDGITSADYKEYISCKLTTAMIQGTKYLVSINVSLAETYSNVACADLAVYFFTDTLPAYHKTTVATLPFIPQVNYSAYGMITDTTGWATLKDTFQADSAYRYMIIGARVPKSSMVTQRVKFDGGVERSYYYIDNVVVATLGSEATQIDDIDLPGLTIYPNPVTDRAVLQISGQSVLPYSVSLTNMMGQTVWQRSNVTDKEIVFERGILPAGVYTYKLSRGGWSAQQGKLLIK